MPVIMPVDRHLGIFELYFHLVQKIHFLWLKSIIFFMILHWILHRKKDHFYVIFSLVKPLFCLLCHGVKAWPVAKVLLTLPAK